MTALPGVAVIMPVYNRAEVVAEAIASARGQTHPDVEVHVVNDGSTDGTADVLDALAADDDRVVVTHQANQGPAVARNRALVGCSTEWVSFLDSDDLLLPDAVERRLAWLHEHPDQHGVMGGGETEIQPGVTPPPVVAAKLAGDDAATIFQTVLIRRSAVEEVGRYDESMRAAEDTDLHWRLIEAGFRLGIVDEPFIVRRVFGDNLSYENPSAAPGLLDLVRRKIDRKRPEDGHG
jgi:glycosyltransferase involved in cell wall biosynthesis